MIRVDDVRTARLSLNRVGFRYERDFVYKGHPQVLYRLPGTRGIETEVSRSTCVVVSPPHSGDPD